MDLSLNSKVALLTGGSDGLGAAAVLELARQGAKVAFCARSADRLSAVQESVLAEGHEALGIVADVSQREEVDRFVATTIETWGRADILVNNAGTSRADGFEALSDELLQEDLDLKLFAAVRTLRGVLPFMREQGGGSVINVINTAAKAPGGTSMPTSISRAAGMALTKATSKDLGRYNIRVNAVCVANVESSQHQRTAKRLGISVEEFYRTSDRLKSIPVGRFGTAEEFGALVAFLASDEAAYISGTAINFDGGQAPVV